jgi:multidrug efflux pump subunit AcrB
MAHKTDTWLIENSRNTARFFTENRHISWVVLVATAIWGIYGYLNMPQRKDPDIPLRVSMAIGQWPGVKAEKVEQLVTRKIEEKVAENIWVDEIKSTTRTGVAYVTVVLKDNLPASDVGKQLDDIALRLAAITDLPDGAAPVTFLKDFGNTAALMLTVASPKPSEVELSLRAQTIRRTIEQVRAGDGSNRVAMIVNLPLSLPTAGALRPFRLLLSAATGDGIIRDGRVVEGPGFVGIDVATDRDDSALTRYGRQFLAKQLRSAEFHPDAWPAILIRDLDRIEAQLTETAGDKYSYRQLDDFTELMKRTFQTIPQVSKIDRAGMLEERVYLMYSQERLASYGFRLSSLKNILSSRNTPISGGIVEVGGKSLAISASGEFTDEKEIGNVIIDMSRSGTPTYLRDIFEVERGYDSPPRYLNYYLWHDTTGSWKRNRAVTLAIQMRPGEQIAEFGKEIDATLARLKDQLPEDLVYARTSDQPLQVEEKVSLFMDSLVEAIILVVLIALIGFWEWRSAFLLSLSIPLTLAMTFGMMSLLGIDVQQVTIASLIIALGLLVDDPVVAGDSIKRDLALGHPPIIAAWLGPTKLATAILFATITNIVAYLPFLLLSGDTGLFLYALPVVLTCSLVASRIVSMTFIPLLGYYILRPDRKPEKSMEERRRTGFTGWYTRVGRLAIEHRGKVFVGSLAFLAFGAFVLGQMKTQFFPKDLSYLSYVDVWLPEDASLSATQETTREVERLIREVADEIGKRNPGEDGKPKDVLVSLTSFIGGGGPRFWQSLSPEQRQENYATVIIQARDKHDTQHILDELQLLAASRVAGARVNARQFETGSPVGVPVAVRLSGDDMGVLRLQAGKVNDIFRAIPTSDRVQDDWGAEAFAANLRVDPDKANLSGVTNADVAASTAAAMNGMKVAVLREGNKQVPIVSRLRMTERAQLSDLENLYIYPSEGTEKIPLTQISTISYSMEPAKINRYNQFRAITVGCFPAMGVLPSEVLGKARPQLEEIGRTLPPGYKMEIVGEQEKQEEGFQDLAVVMAISIAMIFLALVIQFRNAVKPWLVFAAIPYGMVGALTALWIMGTPFGFMAFLGIASLIGVIVSHVIVLFDFIEEAHAKGESLTDALLDAGIVRLRPVLITVGATVLALFPLAMHGGPLWEPLCYAQIGGLSLATFITLLLVPVLYAIFVLDLKIVKWETKTPEAPAGNHGSA